jgi:predicted HAD superfamily Cof-like phosphohydrolase
MSSVLFNSPDFFDVRAFHSKFGQPTDQVDTPAALMPDDQFLFRRKFLFEELDEYGVAFNKGNLIMAADALFDFVYVCFGTVLFMRAGPSHFEDMAWPSFDRTLAWANRHGYRRNMDARPALLTLPYHEAMHQRISSELRLFIHMHQTNEHAAVQMSLSYLWNAAWAAYLTAALMNVPWNNCWRHVQAANMRKVRAQPDGSDSKRGSGFDVVKPKGWCAPDEMIAGELEDAGAIINPEHLAQAKRASEPKS